MRTIRSWGYDAAASGRGPPAIASTSESGIRRSAGRFALGIECDGRDVPLLQPSPATATACAKRFSSDSDGASTASGEPPGTATDQNRKNDSRRRSRLRSLTPATT